MSTPPNILVLLTPDLYDILFLPNLDQELRSLGNVTFQTETQGLSSSELAARIGGVDIVISGWGMPVFTEEVLAAADRLELVAHSAGSIKSRLPPTVFEQDIRVTHAAGAIAPAVADLTLLLIMLMLRRAYHSDRTLHSGGNWRAARPDPLGEEIAGQRVGVVGAGYTGRQVIALLQKVGAELWVCDPYLSEEDASDLGVHQVELDELFAKCPIVTLQAPYTPETHGMIGAQQLALLRDGAVFINTARGALVDPDALLAELQSGRIRAALDVFEPEPLPQDSPLRQLDNVFLTAHIAGASQQARQRQGQAMVDEIRRFLAGEPLRYEISRAQLATMA